MKEGQAHLVASLGTHSPWHTSARSWVATCHGLVEFDSHPCESPFLQTSSTPLGPLCSPWDIWLNMKMMLLVTTEDEHSYQHLVSGGPEAANTQDRFL